MFYSRKYFEEMLKQAKKLKKGQVFISHPSILGDNYEELIENMSSLANANLTLNISKPEYQQNEHIKYYYLKEL